MQKTALFKAIITKGISMGFNYKLPFKLSEGETTHFNYRLPFKLS